MEKKENKTIFEIALKNYVESKKSERCYYMESENINYITLFKFLFTDAVLCNDIINIDDEFIFNNELDEKNELDTDDEEIYPEFYQYYIVNIDDWKVEAYKEYLKEKNESSDVSLFYSNILGVYVAGISHFGTSWDYVPTSIKIERN